MSIENKFNNPTDFTHLKDKKTARVTVTEKIEENIDYKDKYFRLYADFENHKKRVKKDSQDIVNKTKIEILNSILDLDNDLHFAKKSLPNNEGIDIIIDKFKKYLLSQGIEEIQTNRYDQDIHEVISIVDSDKEIVDVVSKGYMIDNKPFRYPKIILGK